MKILQFWVILIFPVFLGAQLPFKPARTITINTTEGTAMNIDVSPDGKTLVFDLLGEIFIISTSGGKAKQLTHGLPVNAKPVWSPNGNYIAYLSDINANESDVFIEEYGDMSLRIIDTNGTSVFFIRSHEVGYVLGNSEVSWSPDGESVFVGNYRYYLLGGKKLMPKLSGRYRYRGFSENGKYLYLSGEIVSKEKGKEEFRFWGIQGFNLSTGEIKHLFISNIDQTRGCNFRMSPDSSRVVYLKGQNIKYDTNEPTGQIDSLIVIELATGKQVSAGVLNIKYPGIIINQRYAFSPDSRYVYIGYGGKIHRIDVANYSNDTIPFVVNAIIETAAVNYNEVKLNFDSIKANYIRSVQMRPDEKQILFTAFNRIYVKNLPEGRPYQLCPQPFSQIHPTYSSDGRSIIYSSFYDSLNTGDIWRVSSSIGGVPEKISKKQAVYRYPVWSHDGREIYYLRQPEGASIGARKLLLEQMDLESGKIKLVASEVFGAAPVSVGVKQGKVYFSPEHIGLLPKTNKERLIDLIYSKQIGDEKQQVIATGTNYETTTTFWNGFHVSPDGQYVVFQRKDGGLFLASLKGKVDQPVSIYDPIGRLQIIRFVENGEAPRWENEGRVISWSSGNMYYRVNLDKVLLNALEFAQKGVAASNSRTDWYLNAPVKSDLSIQLDIAVPYYKSKGTVVLKNARLITMKGREVVEGGSIVVKNGKIVSVLDKGAIKIPSDAEVIDCEGKTVMPGLIDIHYHGGNEGPILYQGWEKLANLSFGVTTCRNPSGVYEITGTNELVNAGLLIGPRYFGAGSAIRASELINSLTDARRIVKNHKLAGAVVIKEYNTGNRFRRMWLQKAALESGINITHEGSEEVLTQISMIKDGTTGIEHSPNWGETYEDVIQLYAKSGVYLTPTLRISNSAYDGSGRYFIRAFMRHPDPRFTRFAPNSAISVLDKMVLKDFDSTRFIQESQIVARIINRGGNILLSGHAAEDQGIAIHHELWTFQMGGMSAHQALESGTILAAKGLGMQKYFGSLEPGKIADLLILDKNPLENIRNSTSIRYVMKDGILYDSYTLDKIWPDKKKMKSVSTVSDK